ncbi:MAG: ATP-binding protein [Acidimicrobiales bacterium]
MNFDLWDPTAAVTYDHKLLDELASLRFVDGANNVIVMGPVGVGKTFLATALGHTAVRRRHSVHFERADKLLKRLASAVSTTATTPRSANSSAWRSSSSTTSLTAMDANDTADIYEIVVERHRRVSTIITSNREPNEWIALMADPLLAQSAIDRLTSAAHELIIEGDSYRTRQRPTTS